MMATLADLRDAPATLPRATGLSALDSADAPGLQAALAAHGGELFGFAYRSLRDRSLAEDALQETFVRAWRARARYDASVGPMRSWLFAIARHVVIDLARARARRVAMTTGSTLLDTTESPDELEGVVESWQVREAIRRLGPLQRHVLVEIYYRGRTSAELAQELGIPEGTVRSRLFYALRALRPALEELGLNS